MQPRFRNRTVPVIDYESLVKQAKEEINDNSLEVYDKELTEEEKNAIMKYKSFESIKINEKLRNNDLLTNENKIFIKNLDSALKKMPFYVGDIVRNLTFRNNNELSKFLYGIHSNSEITFSAYTSVSFGEIFSSNTQVQLNIQNSKKARDISKFGLSEDEVLYERNSKFKVINAIIKDNIFYINLVEA